jgi:hypothetical protein
MGRAGQYLGIPQYMRYCNDKASKFGHALTAAAMYACVECEQYELGLQLYHDLGNDPSSSEWQWAGGYGTIHPLCRDLALQCMGQIRQRSHSNNYNATSGYSDSVTEILKQIIDDEGLISQKALISVFRVFESEGDVEKAIRLMNLVLSYREGQMNWKVVGESPDNFIIDSSSHDDLEVKADGLSDDMLQMLVMETCNVAGEYGLTILLTRLGLEQNFNTESNNFEEQTEESIVKLLDFQPHLSTNDEILAATMLALCGLGRQGDAILLYNKVMEGGENNDGNWDFSMECVAYAHSLGNKQNDQWNEVYQQMIHVLFLMQCMNKIEKPLLSEELNLLRLAVSKMLRSSTEASQPKAGLYLAKATAAAVSRNQNVPSTSIKRTFRSIFGFKDKEIDNQSLNDISSLNTFLSSSDELLSSTMEAYKTIGELDEALLLFFNKWETDSKMRKSVRSAPFHPNPDHPDRKWINSCNVAIDLLLIQNRFEHADAFFQAILPSYRSAETFLIMAKKYATDDKWDKVGKLYDDAVKQGCLSDELAILAMEGIGLGQIDGKMRILRSIVDEIASSKNLKPGAWIFQNYWEIKRRLGFHHARLLMWWNDPSKTQEEEIRIALQHLHNNKCSQSTVDSDVLECIIDLAGHKHLDLYGQDSRSDEALSSQKGVADTIINAVLTTLDLNGEANLSLHITKAFKALAKIRAKISCVELAIAIIDRGHEYLLCNTSIHIARSSAIEVDDKVSLNKIESIRH